MKTGDGFSQRRRRRPRQLQGTAGRASGLSATRLPIRGNALWNDAWRLLISEEIGDLLDLDRPVGEELPRRPPCAPRQRAHLKLPPSSLIRRCRVRSLIPSWRAISATSGRPLGRPSSERRLEDLLGNAAPSADSASRAVPQNRREQRKNFWVVPGKRRRSRSGRSMVRTSLPNPEMHGRLRSTAHRDRPSAGWMAPHAFDPSRLIFCPVHNCSSSMIVAGCDVDTDGGSPPPSGVEPVDCRRTDPIEALGPDKHLRCAEAT